MNNGDGPKYNNGQFPIEGGLEKGSEANVTEDGGNNSMELDYAKLFTELDDHKSFALEQRRLVGQFQEEDRRELDEELVFLKKNESFLRELFSNNPASVAQEGELFQKQGSKAHGEIVSEEMLNEQSNVVEGILAPLASTVLGGSRSAPQTVRRGHPARQERPAPEGVKIKVVTRRSRTDKPTQYNFHVDPDEDVAGLRLMLANKEADVPPSYQFYYDMAVMNELYSFRAHKIDGVGVGVPKIEVMDVTANSQLISLIRKINSQDYGGPSIHKTEAAKRIRNA